jgi:hypothetical protein
VSYDRFRVFNHRWALSEQELSMNNVLIEQKSYEMPPHVGISIAHFLTVAIMQCSLPAQNAGDSWRGQEDLSQRLLLLHRIRKPDNRDATEVEVRSR